MQKRLIGITLISITLLQSTVYAQAARDFAIIPEPNDPDSIGTTVDSIGAQGGQVIDTYNQEAEAIGNDIGTAIATGVMTRDTILDYLTYLANFLSQLGLFIGAAMILFAGYQYGTAIFQGGNASKASEAINNAIIGVIVLIFAYAGVRILVTTFLS